VAKFLRRILTPDVHETWRFSRSSLLEWDAVTGDLKSGRE